MELSLSHLSMLIELTERQFFSLKNIIDNESSTEEEVDDAGELSMQYLALSSALSELYKDKWSQNSEHPQYEDLIKEIQQAN